MKQKYEVGWCPYCGGSDIIVSIDKWTCDNCLTIFDVIWIGEDEGEDANDIGDDDADDSDV